ncbi:MAG: hypothetical protein JST86_16330 [Bacteroidetes bacterium]|nr:hypothetical protein [Bacteroidota bacterium]
MKSLSAIILIAAFAAQSFSGGFIMLDYYSHTAAFAKNCENKARPQMHCNGRCQMMKKLKAEEKKDEQNPERKADNKTVVLSSKSFFCSVITAIIPAFSKPSAGSNTFSLQDMEYAFFHPPQA